MIGYIILAVVLMLLVVLCLTSVGVQVIYGAAGFSLAVKVWNIHYTILPAKAKDKKKKPEKTGKNKAAEDSGAASAEKKRDLGGSIRLFRSLLPVGLDIMGSFLRKLMIDELELCLTIPGSRDPAQAAIAYGSANALLGAVWAPMQSSMQIKKAQVHTQVDFQAEEPVIYLKGALSIRIGRAVPITLVSGFRALFRYFKWKKQRKEMK